MDESDEDFKELCASFFQRVKKNGPKDGSGERKRPRAPDSTQTRSRPQGTKLTTAKSSAPAGPRATKARPGSRAPRARQSGPTRCQEQGPVPPDDGEGGALAPAAPPESTRSTQTDGAPGSGPPALPSCLAATEPSPSERTAELVLRRMQRFKRADPDRLTHAPPEAVLQEMVSEGPQEGTPAGQGTGPRLPVTESDVAVAWALQQELGQEHAAARGDSLEEKGLFFCQICHKNLSAMNVIRREQHVNRCLDEVEKATRPSAPQIPECPICGKPFLTTKSRTSHLKQCAARMEVGPQLLLQAVRLQMAQPEGAPSLPAPVPSFSSLSGGLKRKGAASRKEPQKRWRVSGPEAPSEDLLVAMALSRSELEARPVALRPGSAAAERLRPGAEKKSRKKKAASPPRLLVQDAEITGRQIEDRVAQLLAEEAELASTPPLPAGGRLKEELERASWCLRPPAGKQHSLWEGSALTQAWALDSFYTASLVPPLVLQRPTKVLTQEPAGPPEQPGLGSGTSPAPHSTCPAWPGPPTLSPSASQREHQALQDLVDLAGEGLSASPQPCSGDPTGSEGAAGMDSLPGCLPLTGFVLPAEETQLEGGSQATRSLSLLVADLGAMVNNPQLSDVQFQTDSGELLHAHKFVLYARCPLLTQHVSSNSFSAVEDGDMPTQRVLLSDVSTEAARAFLHYLYTADTHLPPQLAPDLASLAHRFGVGELARLCERAAAAPDTEDGQQEGRGDEACESRAENFHALLRAMWVGEEEEEAAAALLKPENCEEDREKVNEAEMEEIYEFAATQRKRLPRGGTPGAEEESGQPEDGPGGVRATHTALTAGSCVRQSSGLLLRGQCSDGEEGEETPSGAPHPSSPAGPPQGCRAHREGGAFPVSVDADDDEQPFLLTQGGCPQAPRISSAGEEGSGTGEDRGLGSSPALSCPHLSSQAPPQGRSPHRAQPHPHLEADSAPPVPQSPRGAARLTPQDSPSQRKRSRHSLSSPGDPSCQKGQQRASLWGRRNKGVLISPQKSLSIDLTQPQPDHSSGSSQSPPAHGSREDEVILLLDSDEELELQQTQVKSVFHEPPEERKVLEVSAKSCELFPIIDVDTDQEASQSPPLREASPRQPDPGSAGEQGPPRLLCRPASSPDEDSSSDASWLVPATPLALRNRGSSSQAQALGLGCRLSAGQVNQLRPTGSSEQSGGPEAATSASCLSPSTPGSPDGGRQVCGSPGSPPPVPQALPSTGPAAGCGRPPRHPPQHQPRSPPGPSPARRAPAGEVVEVEDSGDEREVASQRAGGSPLLPGDAPAPEEACCWHAEPLSPIPIDHLNLERTAPLSASSPIPGGAAPGHRRSWVKSPGASSPGRGTPSFLSSALWDDWDGDEGPPGPRAQSPPTRAEGAQQPGAPGTPGGAGQKNLPPKVPITPMPRYSLMETPVLKKELDRFGVRPLPKRQMVLKLKEIFQYTHQTLESDSEGESPAPPEAAPRRREQQPGGSAPAPSTTQAAEAPRGPDRDTELPASQGSTAPSADGSDSSFSSQSSASGEVGRALECAGDEAGEEGAGAARALATEAALGRYIRARPALYRRVLRYEPLELAELRAGLRRQGVRVAAGRLLDLLDAQGITFTTAAARRAQLSRRRRRRPGRGGKAAGASPPP
ncbi:LOW QUALITY PROTEIN: structure-specific endonuclease subunit SLX4 [Talpa occidentalis]|uniref:LOW QUALITY PROTEIN: structure-specific endonuclease subunit SLX4 n=1 Tax=Talpa occidentalis TaxID=50954 RepID=UPI00188E2482|nr:LOW QUALITY PROTEIN: structure-specific endonuclease subunit SLX4 [Talpa occidentalis]